MAKKKKKKPDKKGAADAANEEPGGKRKGGMLMSLITAIALAGASFGTVFMLPDRSAPAATETHEAASENGPVRPHIEDIEFVELEPLTISLGQESHILKIGITLEAVPDAISAHDQQLRDAFMGYLRALRLEQIEDAAYMAQMRAQLLRRARLVKGADAVHGILITEFLVR